MSTMPVNPIIPGYAPDPSIVLVDGTYFLVNSNFHAFPGLPIYVSEDLISWKQIGNALNRREQMSLKETDTLLYPQKTGSVLLATGGLYAPTIRHHNGTFYIVCTNVLHEGPTAEKDRCENFILSTTDIWNSKWSDPVYFEFRGIDPSLLFDDDGRVYVHGSRGPGPGTTINQFELDVKTGKKLSEEKTIWKGTGGIYPEGPHIYKKDGWYYCMISEGGTHENHMITVARSKDVWGPYEANPNNPILTARGTDEYIQYTGHCDCFQDKKGEWWGVCLGVRKDKQGRFIMGRETFLTKCSWPEGDWPKFERVPNNPGGLTRQASVPGLTAAPMADYIYFRDVDLSRFSWSDEENVMIRGGPVDMTDKYESPALVGKRQRKLDGATSATCRPKSGSWAANVKAGLASYKDEHRFVRIYYDTSAGAIAYELKNLAKKIHKTSQTSVEEPGSIKLTIEYEESQYRLLYKIGSGDEVCLGTIDTIELTGPDFVGPVVGPFVVTGGEDFEVEFRDLQVD
ncbi:hypothetical protein NLU13_6381 [Sarocladium strictum]|uniref:Beta-xylosidase C-terminal Concanavalin A-like domain-containing protein n=1 Tax=Sarocladium strictum TaxID=5046 RepID=A0AA39GGE2_SARSR|nr:hypothetical protein NLU13_6381 [Sarocladium strictum]